MGSLGRTLCVAACAEKVAGVEGADVVASLEVAPILKAIHA